MSSATGMGALPRHRGWMTGAVCCAAIAGTLLPPATSWAAPLSSATPLSTGQVTVGSTPVTSPTASATPTATIMPSPADTPTPTASPASMGRPVQGYGPGTLTALTLPVHDSGRTSRQVWVWLPPGVTDNARLPVVYLLHGQDESPRTPFANGIANALTKAFAAGTAPFELVVPDGVSAARSDDEWADAWDGADSLETFVGTDTVAAVEGDRRRPRSLRAITGFSMGGFGAAVMAARQSSLFGQFVGFAGYYRIDDPENALGSNGTYRYVHTPVARADQYATTRMLLLACSADSSSALFAGELARMRSALSRAGHPAGYRLTPGPHAWSWVNSQLPLAAAFLSQGWHT